MIGPERQSAGGKLNRIATIHRTSTKATSADDSTTPWIYGMSDSIGTEIWTTLARKKRFRPRNVEGQRVTTSGTAGGHMFGLSRTAQLDERTRDGNDDLIKGPHKYFGGDSA